MLRLLAPKVLGYNSVCKQLLRNMTDSSKPIESVIRQKLKEAFSPTHMDVINESYMHNVPKGAETHFKVVVVSDKFTDLALLKRHQMVNSLLSYELQHGVHALSIVAKTPSQWNDSDKIVKPSPNCRGGFGK
ncbi:bolA-like protein DDB_G0274169 isoform X1 [Trichogramma pretiosum]|uniref:bolA-like protein DDB_G0274169 isoform X1 n=1 Tax=Trichogramma pretiosum TaxID=7493 RepID=UPI0006C97C5F|nr:bolA-like protein DDB_G0274169 isoform X1 [Trichogramma pretiosum]